MEQRSSAMLKSRTGKWVLNFIGQEMESESASNPNDASCTSIPEAEVRHPTFFFDNILVAIKIENTLFNVHKYQLVKSEVFSDMFKVPNPGGNTPEEGSSPENPIIIQGVAASDFAALLTVLYTSHFSSNHPDPDAPLIVPAFRLANMFNFSDLRAFLLPLAEKNLNDVDKVIFAREFDIKEWLAPAHIRLCQREEPLSTEEARKLGVDSVLMISRMREQYRSRGAAVFSGLHYCYGCSRPEEVTYGENMRCTDRNSTLHFYLANPNARGTSNNAKNTTMESEVKKWVEESYTTMK